MSRTNWIAPMRIFDRLYVKVYATVVGTLLLALLVSVAIWWAGPEQAMARKSFGMASGQATAALGDPDAAASVQKAAIRRLSELLESDIAVYDRAGRLVGAAGAPLPPPEPPSGSRMLIRRPWRRCLTGCGATMLTLRTRPRWTGCSPP